MKTYLSFDDVLLLPQFSSIVSRADVHTTVNFLGTTVVPLISSNMDSVTGTSMAKAMADYGALAALPRFQSIEDNVKMFRLAPKSLVSLGLGDNELERAAALYHAGATKFIIDVAHGATTEVVRQTKALKHIVKDSAIVVGNFATGESVKAFVHHLGGNYVSAIKVGIGGGCFGAGTRILMSNGSYKNIEDVKVGDRVINKDGNPVNVVGTKNSGVKKVIRYKNNAFYKDSLATPDHLHWVGDYSTTKNINDHSLVETLGKVTKKDESKFKWKRLDETKNSTLLLPKKVQFELRETFEINTRDFYTKQGNFDRSEIEELVRPSYDLGHLLGTFLGDGCSAISEYKGSTRGQVSWYFGLKEQTIANKVVSALKNTFNINASFELTDNIITIHAYSLPLARFFDEFGKKENKHLPEKYRCSHGQYLLGMLDGLIDSDGTIGKDDRHSLQNTSHQLIELFGFLNFQCLSYFPSMSQRSPSSGGLENCNIDNCKPSYTARGLGRPENYLTEKYQVTRINSYEEYPIEIETYDIEVNCETHSFIANNAIVHNSACTTRIVTGAGLPTYSSILDCRSSGIPIIADGGIRSSSDFTKALAAGASVVMVGRLLAGCDEAPSELKTIYIDKTEVDIKDLDGKLEDFLKSHNVTKGKKQYQGSASAESYASQGKNATHRTPEGTSFTVLYTGPVKNTLEQLEAGLRSGMSYVGARTIAELQKTEFAQITNAGIMEGVAHGKNA